ncbi:cell division protein FtsQ/DivIB [Pseudobacteriovorax antillogorgiicola]|uniref:Cell division protein FtsQ n=1 Tax=Pseudobacteriovorax antillogorgiicola TaxID=1513793 RepID=A0A1Y6B562_9BACT|nr:cell division protein FtsQ/DivIB [Pseudobacteriovorax antillogorgiicola]TCS59164.1 cell division protein FtsQ [Pseudobacteriovorax antillogorgiicola]SME91065.1 Cell division protein FtsQ [Pseudobacteriovorax antillogorgiicola]
MAKIRKKHESLLTKQKLKRRHHIPTVWFTKVSAPIIVIAMFSLSFLGVLKSLEQYAIPLPLSPIQVHPHQIAIQHQEFIKDYISRNPIQDLQQVESFKLDLQKKLAAKSLSTLALTPYKILLKAEFHQSLAAIEYGIKRLLSDKGKVFGQYSEKHHHHLPMISGISIDRKLDLDNEQSVVMSERNNEVLQEALLLINDGLRYNIRYKAIHFDSFRGFQVLLFDKRIRVEMGRRPFNKRYIKLEKILSNLSKKRVNTARIELDYQGKAFIKESTL